MPGLKELSYSHKHISDSSTTNSPKPHTISKLLAFPAEAIGIGPKAPSCEDTPSPGINPCVLGLRGAQGISQSDSTATIFQYFLSIIQE